MSLFDLESQVFARCKWPFSRRKAAAIESSKGPGGSDGQRQFGMVDIRDDITDVQVSFRGYWWRQVGGISLLGEGSKMNWRYSRLT